MLRVSDSIAMSALLKVPPLPASLVSASDVKKRRLSRASRGSSSVLSAADNGNSRALENDDEAELQRLERRKAAASASSSARLGRPQLLRLYSDVLKLSSSGRIASASVWSMPLIDNMIELITQTGDADDGGSSSSRPHQRRPPFLLLLPDSHSDSSSPSDSSHSQAPSSSRQSQSSAAGSSVNFAKASCTLDASILLYSGRVDSVHRAAHALAGGLSREQPQTGGQHDDEDDAEGERVGKPARRRRAMATLESQPGSLQLRTAERPLTADPFFKRTSAAFDAGGSGGMLLHQLSVYHQLDIALDGQEVVHSSQPQQAEDDAALTLQLDLSQLRGELEANAPDWRQLSVCPLMAELQAAKAELDGSRPPDTEAELSGALPEAAMDGCDDDGGPGEDLQSLHAQLDAAIAQEQSLDALIEQQHADEAEQSDGEQQQQQQQQPAHTAPSSSSSPPSLFSGMFGSAGVAHQRQPACALGLHSSWASLSLGHWKLRPQPASSAAAAAAVSRPARASKAAAAIDFFCPPPPLSAFALVSRRQAARCTELSQATLDRNSAQQLALLLPSAALDPPDLLRLFTKPTLALQAARRAAAAEGMQEAAAVSQQELVDCGADEQDGVDECETAEQPASGLSLPLTSYSLLAAPPAVARLSIGYAQAAKRVDVKALKACLRAAIASRQQRQREEEQEQPQPAAAAALPFQSAIDSLSAPPLSSAASRLQPAVPRSPLLPVCCLSVAAQRGGRPLPSRSAALDQRGLLLHLRAASLQRAPMDARAADQRRRRAGHPPLRHQHRQRAAAAR